MNSTILPGTRLPFRVEAAEPVTIVVTYQGHRYRLRLAVSVLGVSVIPGVLDPNTGLPQFAVQSGNIMSIEKGDAIMSIDRASRSIAIVGAATAAAISVMTTDVARLGDQAAIEQSSTTTTSDDRALTVIQPYAEESADDIADHNAIVNQTLEDVAMDVPNRPFVDGAARTVWIWQPKLGLVRES
jgi:hypothetical protein